MTNAIIIFHTNLRNKRGELESQVTDECGTDDTGMKVGRAEGLAPTEFSQPSLGRRTKLDLL